jgi:hypothetical protein
MTTRKVDEPFHGLLGLQESLEVADKLLPAVGDELVEPVVFMKVRP